MLDSRHLDGAIREVLSMIAPASKVLMVRPRSFQSNIETAATNAFQQKGNLSPNEVNVLAQNEFDHFRSSIESYGVSVICHDEPIDAHTPDALFPNNWFAILPSGQAFLFPMQAVNRRREVQPSWIEPFARIKPLIDLRHLTESGVFLEGTGSLILDHNHNLGYACLSERTHLRGIKEFERHSGYSVFTFTAKDIGGTPFYHTNVMMALGQKTAVVCLESIPNESERLKLCDVLTSTGHEIVSISQNQVLEFAGNLLFLTGSQGRTFWVCSERAFHSFTEPQRQVLKKDGDFIFSPLPTIENIGGGSARCMLGEVF